MQLRFDIFRRHLTFATALVFLIFSGRAQTVNDAAGLATALATATADDVITLSASWTDDVDISSQTLTGVTITGATGHTIDSISLSSVTGLTLSGLNVENDNSGGANWASSSDAAVSVTSSTGVVLMGLVIDCGPTETPLAQQTVASLSKRFGGFYISNSTVTVTGCEVYRVRDGLNANDSDMTVTGCDFVQIFEDAITGGRTHWTVDDNTATLFEGVYGKRFYGTITGVITAGMLLDNGLSGDSKKVLSVVNVAAGYVEGHYNNYRKPSISETFSDGLGNSIEITSDTSEFDGIHGDFFQPLLKAGGDSTENKRCYARRNYVYRTSDYTFDTLGQEQNVQGILAQLNGSAYNHAPLDISYNVIAGGQPIGITSNGGSNGQILNNTIIWSEYRVGGADISVSQSTNLTISGNVGDNNSGGVIDDDGGNTNVTITDNVFVDGDNGDQLAEYGAIYTYPQTLVAFAPVLSGVVDLGDAGALTTAGVFRSSTLSTGPLRTDGSGRTKWSIGSGGGVRASLVGPIEVPSFGAPVVTALPIDEDAEDSGDVKPAGWTDTGSVNWGQTVGTLHGSESLELAAATSNYSTVQIPSTASFSFFCKFEADTSIASLPTVVEFLDGNWDTMITVQIQSDGDLEVRDPDGTLAANGESSGSQVSADTEGNLWIEGAMGTGSDAAIDVTYTTESTVKDGTPDIEVIAGEWNNQIEFIRFKGNAGGTFKVDNIEFAEGTAGISATL